VPRPLAPLLLRAGSDRPRGAVTSLLLLVRCERPASATQDASFCAKGVVRVPAGRDRSRSELALPGTTMDEVALGALLCAGDTPTYEVIREWAARCQRSGTAS